MCQPQLDDSFNNVALAAKGSHMKTSDRHSFVKVAGVALLTAAALLSTPTNLLGYADPGTGAFLYQAAYAAFLGGAFYFRKFLDRIFSKRR